MVVKKTFFCYAEYYMDDTFHGIERKTAVITGATSGIGQATARRFAAAGYRVIAIGRNPERLEHLRKILAGNGHVFLQCNLANGDERTKMITDILHHALSIDVLVNNAGIGRFAPFSEGTEEEWREVVETNLMVPMILTQALLGAITKAEGTIVNVASVAGKRTFKYLTAYCASKFGLIGFSNSLRRELKYAGLPVHVCVICPPATATAFFTNAGYDTFVADHPLVHLLDPAVVAEEIFEAVQKKKREVVITVRAKILDRFAAVFPALVESLEDWVNARQSSAKQKK